MGVLSYMLLLGVIQISILQSIHLSFPIHAFIRCDIGFQFLIHSSVIYNCVSHSALYISSFFCHRQTWHILRFYLDWSHRMLHEFNNLQTLPKIHAS